MQDAAADAVERNKCRWRQDDTLAIWEVDVR